MHENEENEIRFTNLQSALASSDSDSDDSDYDNHYSSDESSEASDEYDYDTSSVEDSSDDDGSLSDRASTTDGDNSEEASSSEGGDFSEEASSADEDSSSEGSGDIDDIEALFENDDAVELQSGSKEFLQTLKKYLKCRKKMTSKYKKIENLNSVAKLTIKEDSGGIQSKGNDPLAYKAHYQQVSVNGTATKTLDELYDAAETALPEYRRIVDTIVDEVRKECPGDVLVAIAPLKGRQRARAKALDDYNERTPGPAISWLFDIVRGSIEFSSAAQIIKCIALIQKDKDIHIVKAKNRFKSPTLSGYRDLNLCIRIRTKEGFYHICELQIHHEALKKFDGELHSHQHYEYFRKYFGGATQSLKDRLEDLKIISKSKDKSSLLDNSCDEKRLERLAFLFHEHLCEYDLAIRAYKMISGRHLYDADQPNKILVADNYMKMANAYQQREQFQLALDAYDSAKAIYNLCDQDRSLGLVYHNMAGIYSKQGDLKRSIALYEKSLRLKQRSLNPDNASIANTCNNMALVMLRRRKMEKAIPLLEEALRLKTTEFGTEHPSVAATYNNIANARRQEGNYEEAIALYEKSCGIKRRALGENHESVALALNNIAHIKRDQSKYDEALEGYRGAENILLSSVGKNHPRVGDTYSFIGLVYMDKGELAEAMTWQKRALKILTKGRGEESLSVASVHRSIGNIWYSQGELDEAMTAYEHAVEIFTKVGKSKTVVAVREKMAKIREDGSKLSMNNVQQES
mmetsp:Transcript_8307/g.19997  ORF Transcript_8307/g.19997 Transcript_8307/m.19997 type:complete len:746 (-) Transcript_8307:650-2887(-)